MRSIKPEMFPRKTRVLFDKWYGCLKATKKMKKLMFICTFTILALFASASTASTKKISPLTQKVEVTAKKVNSTVVWDVTVTCGNGYTFTSCCYSSYSSAQNAGWALYFEICE